MIDVHLLEWGRLGPEAPELRGVELSGSASVLAEELTKSGRLSVLETRKGITLEARSYVGRIRLGDMLVTIRPKLDGTRLLRLFEYAYDLDDLRSQPDSVAFGATDDLFVDVLVQCLLAEAQTLRERGLHRTYVRVAEELANLHGAIDTTQLVTMAASGRAAVPCIHHPRDEDHLLNQVIKAGLRVAVAVATDDRLRMSARRAATALETVSEVSLSATTLARARRAVDRRVTHYGPAVTLIEILWAGTGLDLEDAAQRVHIPGFLFDMNRFWQALLGRLLRENLEGVQIIEDRSVRGALRYADGAPHPRFQVPTTRPDFVVKRASKTVAMLDAKYRDLWTNRLPEPMLYQLAVYAAIQGAGGVATILYPTEAEAARDVRIEICAPDAAGKVQAVVVLRPVHPSDLLKHLQGSAASRQLWVEQLVSHA